MSKQLLRPGGSQHAVRIPRNVDAAGGSVPVWALRERERRGAGAGVIELRLPVLAVVGLPVTCRPRVIYLLRVGCAAAV